MIVQPPSQFVGLSKCLILEYVGNYFQGARARVGCRTHNRSGRELS
jgi:hypothetical protein